MSYQLLRIVLDTSAIRNSSLASKVIGSSAVRKRLEEVRDELAELAVEAYQSKVPIDTGLLREEINWEPVGGAGEGYQAVIEVKGEHRNRFGKTSDAGELAKHLDFGKRISGGKIVKLSRSRQSLPEGPFNSSRSPFTEGWIKEGKEAFFNIYNAFLDKRRSK